MRKGTVINLKSLNFSLIFLKKNWCLLLLSVAFILGISLGTFITGENGKLFELAKNYMQGYLSVRVSSSFFAVFSGSILLSLVFLAVIFSAGTSVTGVTLVPVFVVLRGVIFGALASLIYSQYALKGIAFNALVLIPPTIVSVIIMLFAGREALLFSLRVIGITLPKTMPVNLSSQFKFYCKRYIIYLLATVFSALLDGWLSIKLVSYFNLT